jgi:hypothetical protein
LHSRQLPDGLQAAGGEGEADDSDRLTAPGAVQRRLQAITLGPMKSRNFMVELAGQFAAKPD